MFAKVKEFAGGYSLKSIKTAMSHDGYSFSATVYKDGKRIGTVSNSGDGGPNYYVMSNDILKSLVEHASKFYDKDYEPEDCFIEMLMNYQEGFKKMKSLMKSKTLFVEKKHKKDENDFPDGYLVVKIAPSAQLFDKMREKYGQDILIINEQELPF